MPKRKGIADYEQSENIVPENLRRDGIFRGVIALLVEGGVAPKRLMVWKKRICMLGGRVVDNGTKEIAEATTHILASSSQRLAEFDSTALFSHAIRVRYSWVEDSLVAGSLLPVTPYLLHPECEPVKVEEKEATKDSNLWGFKKWSDCSTSPESEVDGSRKSKTCNPKEGKQEKHGRTNEGVGESQLCWEEAGESQKSDMVDSLPADTYEPPDLNPRITEPLKELQSIYEDALGDEWRALSYKKVVHIIEQLPFEIKNETEVKHVKGIGKSMAAKIHEILNTGRLKMLESLKADPMVKTMREFGSVWGIGPTRARQLYALGHRTLEGLAAANETLLTPMARLGLRYHADIVERMPRSEVAQIESVVKEAAEKVCHGLFAIATGSYRRGQLSCGDADFVITHPDGHSQEGILRPLISLLQSQSFIVGGQNGTSQFGHQRSSSQHVSETFLGICRLPQEGSRYRRIDIKVYPKAQYPFALIYFTGNDILNRKIRHLANQKGLKLNDQGLFRRAGSAEHGEAGKESIPCETERDVFEQLDLPYPEPHERNW